MKKYALLILLGLTTLSAHAWEPFCSKAATKTKKIVAYLGADSQWDIEQEDVTKLKAQLNAVDVVNYAFVRLEPDSQGNIVPKLTINDIKNIQTLKQLRADLPVVIAVGGWGDREGFSKFVNDPKQRAAFIEATKSLLQENQLDGLDIDWENELLASEEEIRNIAALIREFKAEIGPSGYCVSNAVPATSWYWEKYPDAQLWNSAVDWTTIMAYDHYGTFGMRTEHGAALYENDRPDDNNYPYPKASGDMAVSHYYQQGLTAEKILLGVPFYCHSYYVDAKSIDIQSKNPGLHVSVIDPNINSQVSYVDAWNDYGKALFSYQHQTSSTPDSINYYGLIPIENTTRYRFMSCDSPQSIARKMAYIKGRNAIGNKEKKHIQLGGVSFWSLQQDLAFEEPQSLLRAIYDGLK
ncbi:Chitinase A1 precursor [Legionella steigerwaltii]|uniref:chitinase n=1 Tax=Legionella steigerwaltii TaxID=460 RepID=A0A378L4R2_9GAMM|nr:glycoside hydrolase family 18 protein [Legionella steigerwaltii]KTD72021.1 Chitinase A1 precursor [Legionella steigerwaltii]STY21687.1 Chitinase A1 precursor [Legionella steigerwaltii]